MRPQIALDVIVDMNETMLLFTKQHDKMGQFLEMAWRTDQVSKLVYKDAADRKGTAEEHAEFYKQHERTGHYLDIRHKAVRPHVDYLRFQDETPKAILRAAERDRVLEGDVLPTHEMMMASCDTSKEHANRLIKIIDKLRSTLVSYNEKVDLSVQKTRQVEQEAVEAEIELNRAKKALKLRKGQRWLDRLPPFQRAVSPASRAPTPPTPFPRQRQQQRPPPRSRSPSPLTAATSPTVSPISPRPGHNAGQPDEDVLADVPAARAPPLAQAQPPARRSPAAQEQGWRVMRPDSPNIRVRRLGGEAAGLHEQQVPNGEVVGAHAEDAHRGRDEGAFQPRVIQLIRNAVNHHPRPPDRDAVGEAPANGEDGQADDRFACQVQPVELAQILQQPRHDVHARAPHDAQADQPNAQADPPDAQPERRRRRRA